MKNLLFSLTAACIFCIAGYAWTAPVAESDSEAVFDDSTVAAPAAQKEPVAPPAAQPSSPKTTSVKPVKDSTEIIFDGGEESLFDEGEAAKKARGRAAGDSAQPVQQTETIGADSLQPATVSGPARVQVNTPKDSLQKPSASAKVEDVRSVNFAGNLKEYRSPKLAMLLSLLVPGVGQAYAGNYVKTSIFAVIEAAIIGISIGYNIKGKNERDAAHTFADEHFSKSQFSAYYDSLYNFFYQRAISDVSPGDTASRRMQDIFYAPDGEDFKANFIREVDGRTINYYDYIAGKSFVQGWDDCDPTFAEIHAADYNRTFTSSQGKTYTVHTVPDSAYLVGAGSLAPGSTNPNIEPIYGYSSNQVVYMDWISKANSYYRTGATVLYFLLINHIGSAVDAGITAKQRNDRLLNKQTMWDRVNFYPVCINTGSEITPGCAVRILF